MDRKNALSVDVEDWYHPELVRRRVDGRQKRPQISEAIGPLLDLLNKYNRKATFFILGEVAKDNPGLVRRIHTDGHEIASHGMDHVPLWDLDREGLSRQLDDFRDLMRDILGRDVRIQGFRAPSFSLDGSTAWALDVLREKGYAYDSSVFPVRNALYGLRGAPLEIYSPLDNFKEFPMAACDFWGMRFPVAGGFYLRVIPLFILKRMLMRINSKRPFVFYIHPWESYKFTPRIKALPAVERFITYWGIKGTLRKFEVILRSFSFCPIREVLGV